jgi:4-hydroxybutyryl-CoA dehydratase/vinylacetyl-CoA-Delta-isomerase
MHGAGSPQAQRIMINRLSNIEEKQKLAKVLAGIDENTKRTDSI